MLKDRRFIRNFLIGMPLISSLLLVAVLVSVSNIDQVMPGSVFLFNICHLTISFLFLLELNLMKAIGEKLFGHKNSKIQQSIIYRMTFVNFSFMFFAIQVSLFGQGESIFNALTTALLFASFLSGGIVYVMLQALSAFFKKQKEVEVSKETIRLYGVCYISEFESEMYRLSNNLYALKRVEEELLQEEIIEINERTNEIHSLFTIYEKMSKKGRKEVVEDVLGAMEKLNEKLEHTIYAKDEKYIKLIKRKANRINTKTV